MDAARLNAETFAWQDVGVVRPGYWTYLRFDAVQPGVIVDALRLQLLKDEEP